MNELAVSAVARQSLRAWRFLEIMGTIVTLFIAVLLSSGWRIQKPGDVDTANETAITAMDKRTTALEGNYKDLRDEVKGNTRMLCLQLSRHDANLAGTCTGLPTRDESPRIPR